MSLVSIKQANTAANGTRELLNLVYQNLEAIDKSTLTTIQKIEIAKSFIKKINENPNSAESKASILSIKRLGIPSLASNTPYYSNTGNFALTSRLSEINILRNASNVMILLSIHCHIKPLDELVIKELKSCLYNTFKSIETLAATPNKKSKLLLQFQEQYFDGSSHDSMLIGVYRQVDRAYCQEIYSELLKPFENAAKAVQHNDEQQPNTLYKN